jgi:squalene-associated FAD-dependent desaturase
MRVAVLGAGLAGLACGCELADAGHEVTVFEKRPWAGGKAYSFVDPDTGEEVDNGQHVFMACTTAYTDFLRRLGTLHLTRRQRRLSVAVIDAAGRRSRLWAAPLPPPLHLLPSFALYRHLSIADKLRIGQTILANGRTDAADLDAMTFGAWLRGQGQSETAIRDFWDLIVVPTLNCRSDVASAAQALFIFKEGFLASSGSAAIGVPAAGLSSLHAEPAVRYIEERGGEVRLRCGVDRIDAADGAVTAIVLSNGERLSFDAYVCALPPPQLLPLLPESLTGLPPFDGLRELRYSPIVNLHLWFDGPVADFDFAAFAGCELQWAFNRSRLDGRRSDGSEHLVLSLSAADAYVDLTKAEMLDRLLPQLNRALPGSAARRVLRSALIKEPEATFLPAPRLRRPAPETPLANLHLAGAYTDTGWPATMESAVRSGLAAARAVQVSQGARRPASVLVA